MKETKYYLIFLSCLLSFQTFLYYTAWKEASTFPSLNQYIEPNDSYFNIAGAKEFIGELTPPIIRDNIPNTPYKLMIGHFFNYFGSRLPPIRAFQAIMAIIATIAIYLTGVKIKDPLTGIISATFWAFSFELFAHNLIIQKYSLTLSTLAISLYCWQSYNKEKTKLNLTLAIIATLLLGWFRNYFFALIIIFSPPSRLNLKSLLPKGLVLTSLLFGWLLFSSNESKTHVGVHVYHGFNSQSNGFYQDIPHVRDNAIGHLQEAVYIGEKLSKKWEFSWIGNFWLQKSLSFALQRPEATFRLLLRKLFYLYFFNQWNDTTNINHFLNTSSILPLAFIKMSVLVPFAILGVLTVYLLRHKPPSTLYVFLFISTLSVLATCLSFRYQVQLIPMLTLLAGLGLRNLFMLIPKRRYFHLTLLSILTILLLLPPLINPVFQYGWNQKNRFHYHNHRLINSKKYLSQLLKELESSDFDKNNRIDELLEKLFLIDITIETRRIFHQKLLEPKLPKAQKSYIHKWLGDCLMKEERFEPALKNYNIAKQLGHNKKKIDNKILLAEVLNKQRLDPELYP